MLKVQIFFLVGGCKDRAKCAAEVESSGFFLIEGHKKSTFCLLLIINMDSLGLVTGLQRVHHFLSGVSRNSRGFLVVALTAGLQGPGPALFSARTQIR